MADGAERFTVRRITVALDSSPHARAALAAAADLAARLHAELSALFVEDITYAHLAALNIGRELVMSSGRVQAQPFDPEAVESWYKREAAEARRLAETLARERQVACAFTVVRGRVDVEVLSAAGGADLLVLGIAGRSAMLTRRPGSTALAAAARAPRSVLLLRPNMRLAGHALVAFDGTPGAAKALDAAALISNGDDGLRFSVLLVAKDPADAERLKAEAAARLEALGARTVGFRMLFNAAPAAICRLAHDLRADLLILSADNPAVAGEGRGDLLGDMRCPVLLVR